MEPRLPTAYVAAAAALAIGSACSTAVGGDFIGAKVASAVGKPYSGSPHSRPTGAATRVLVDDGKVREHEYRWKNGCAYALVVDVQSDTVTGWRYTADPAPCSKLNLYTFGT
jgi:hypothetical protein